MVIRKTDQPVGKIKALAEGVAKSETAPPEIRRARAVIVQTSLIVLAIAFGLLVMLVKMRRPFCRLIFKSRGFFRRRISLCSDRS